MLTYSLQSTNAYRVGRMRDDDGSPADAFALPDWRYGPFTGRFADPANEYRIRYVSLSLYGAYLESLQAYRPDLETLRNLTEIIGTDELVLASSIPRTYFDRNAIASANIVVPGDQGLLDLVSAKGMAKAHAAIEAASRRSGHKLSQYDASTLLSATPRAFTQELSRVVFEYRQFNGIAYRSRFDPDAILVALFEGAHDYRDAQYDPIDQASAAFRDACAVHNLPDSLTISERSRTPPQSAT